MTVLPDFQFRGFGGPGPSMERMTMQGERAPGSRKWKGVLSLNPGLLIKVSVSSGDWHVDSYVSRAI